MHELIRSCARTFELECIVVTCFASSTTDAVNCTMDAIMLLHIHGCFGRDDDRAHAPLLQPCRRGPTFPSSGKPSKISPTGIPSTATFFSLTGREEAYQTINRPSPYHENWFRGEKNHQEVQSPNSSPLSRWKEHQTSLSYFYVSARRRITAEGYDIAEIRCIVQRRAGSWVLRAGRLRCDSESLRLMWDIGYD